MSYTESGAAVSPETEETPVSSKSWAATALLALPCLLGLFGAHRFYAGRLKTAWAMLGVSLAGIACIALGVLAKQLNIDALGMSPIYFGAFLANLVFLALFVWASIDLVFIATDNFKDGQGRRIKRL